MNANRPAPIGPLAIALRRLRSKEGGRHVAVIALVFAALLVVGIGLLFFR